MMASKVTWEDVSLDIASAIGNLKYLVNRRAGVQNSL